MQKMLIYKITIFYLFPSYVDILLICGTFVKGKTNVELQRTSPSPVQRKYSNHRDESNLDIYFNLNFRFNFFISNSIQ